MGCGEAGEPESISSTGLALAVQVSDELDVEAVPTLEPGAAAITPAVACGPSQCIVAHVQRLGGSAHVFVTRVAADGTILDAAPIDLGLADEDAAVQAAASANEYVVAWGRGEVLAARVRASDGAVLDPTPIEVSSPAYGWHVATTGTTYAFAYSTSTSAYVKVLNNGVLSGPASIPAAPTTLIAGPSQYLVAWQLGAARVDGATGALLDTPITITKYAYANGDSTAAYADGNYVVLWPYFSTIYAVRIRANDGELLDPDDEFNQLTGAHEVSSGGGVASVLRAGARDGNVVLTWKGKGTYGASDKLYGARIDPSTGLRVDGDSSSPEFTIMTLPSQAEFDVALSQNAALYADRSKLANLVEGPTPPGLIASPLQTFVWISSTRGKPAVATNGEDYLVLWTNEGRIRGTRVDGITGAFMDDPPLDIAASEDFAVTAVGDGYLVAYLTGYTRIDRRMVFSDGTVGPQITPPIINSTLTAHHVKATYNGVYAVVGYGLKYGSSNDLHGIRLDPSTLEPVDSSPKLFDMFYSGGEYALLADTIPVPEQRTFLIPYTSHTGIELRRFRSALGALVDITDIDVTAAPDRLFGTTDGSKMAVWWQIGSMMSVALVDPVSGLPESGYPRDLFDVGTTTHWPPTGQEYFPEAVWYDGRSHLIAMRRTVEDIDAYRHETNIVSIKRYGLDLQPIEGPSGQDSTEVFEVGYDWLETEGGIAAASNEAGRSLLAYHRVDVSRLGRAIKIRFLDNDGLPPADAGADAIADAGADAQDGADGSLPDSGVDALPDSHQDAPEDAAKDVAEDAADGGVDGAVDASVPDAPSDGPVLDAPADAHDSSADVGTTEDGAVGQPDVGVGDSGDPGDNVPPASPGEDSGCGCRTAEPQPARTAMAWLLASLLLVVRGRRRAPD